MSDLSIPLDVYESPREIVIFMPLGGVEKESIEMYFEDFQLVVTGERVRPSIKTDLVLQQEECYRGPFSKAIDLPPYVYFEHIHSTITPENILIITVPKSLQPGKMRVAVHVATSKAHPLKDTHLTKQHRTPPKNTTKSRNPIESKNKVKGTK